MSDFSIDSITCTRCKNPFIPGMVFKSKTHPHMNMIIDYVCYGIMPTIIDWSLIDHKVFNEFLESKGIIGRSTFPYACWGECTHQSMKQRIKKYNLKLDHIEELKIYTNNEYEFSATLNDEVKKKYLDMWDRGLSEDEFRKEYMKYSG